MDLIPHVPEFREDQFRDLFRKQSTPGAPDSPDNPGDRNRLMPNEEKVPTGEELEDTSGLEAGQEPHPPAVEQATPGARKPGAGKAGDGAKKPAEPTKIVFEGIRDRLTLLPLGDLGVRYPVISPDGKTLAFLADAVGEQNIYTYSLDELAAEPAVPRQLTNTHGGKADLASVRIRRRCFMSKAHEARRYERRWIDGACRTAGEPNAEGDCAECVNGGGFRPREAGGV